MTTDQSPDEPLTKLQRAHLRPNRQPNIDVVIGTKAQYIKTAPVLRLLDRKGVRYRLIDTGQHAAIAPRLRRELGLKDPDFELPSKGNVKSIWEAIRWAIGIISLVAFRPDFLRRQVFEPGEGLCLIHGDTPSTLLALLMAKRAGKKVVHLEAGLRSHNLLRPFPEEIIRILCMRWSDMLFAPSSWAMENLRALCARGKCIELAQNTNVEALYYALQDPDRKFVPNAPYALVTVHRVETILNKERLQFAVDTTLQAARDRTVVFILHDPTERKLREFGFDRKLEAKPGIRTLPLVTHGQFVALLANAEFVITDGGSIQEEAYYLGVPCLVMRSETERNEGLGDNVRLSHFDRDAVRRFLETYPSLKRGSQIDDMHPSAQIVDELLAYEFA